MYIPLIRERDKFLQTGPILESEAWQDPGFVRDFEKQLNANFEKRAGTVIFRGIEFPNCEVYTAKDKGSGSIYARLLDAGVPAQTAIVTPTVDKSTFSREVLKGIIDELSYSEVFYSQLRTTLSNNYLPPYYQFEGEEERFLWSTADILRHPKVLIIGPPGCGKTSLVRRLAYDLNGKLLSTDPKDRVVAAYVKLRDVERPAITLADASALIGSPGDPNFAMSKIARGQLVLIFDGLDELDKGGRAQFAQWMREFVPNQPSVRLVITSRVLQELEGSPFSDFRRMQIRPFSESQIFQFCLRFFGDRRVTDGFVDLVRGIRELIEFLGNPLTLSLALALYSTRQVLPFNIGELVDEISKHLTQLWDEKRGIHRYVHITARSTRLLLGKLAFRLQVEEKFAFSPDELMGLVPFEQEEIPPSEVLEEIRTATGLLVERAGSWSFVHRYFQEFFCASYVVESIGNVTGEAALQRVSWAPVWRQIAELCSDPLVVLASPSGGGSSALHIMDRILVILLTPNRLDRHGLDSCIARWKDSLLSLGKEYLNVKLREGGFELIAKQRQNWEPQTLTSIVRNIYHLTKSRNKEIARLLFQGRRAQLARALRMLISAKEGPILVEGDFTLTVRLGQSDRRSQKVVRHH